ncbi:MAG: hypothetical protein JST42_17645 [Bacteroidetes bacterium]|nr:hypothetical protein [Bacteroidota bacterium]
MQARNEILEELRLLSTTVSTISRENPYQVPAGYFDGFPAQVLTLTGEVPFFAGSGDRPLAFSVPDGYFDGFAQNLLNRIKAGQAGQGPIGESAHPMNTAASAIPGSGRLAASSTQESGLPLAASTPESNQSPASAESASQEITRLSPLLNGITRSVPYQVPDNYLEQLSPMLAPLAGLRDKPLYTVPENYFAGVADKVLARIKDQAVSTVNATSDKVADPSGMTANRTSDTAMPAIETANPASDTVNTANPVKQDQPARIISLDRSTGSKNGSRQASRFMPSWLKYSVAAAIAGIIITFGWLRLSGPSGHPKQPVDPLASVSDQDLQTYAESNNDQATTESMNSTATLDINDSDVKSLLGDVPDGDLKQYMEEHGGAVDIATN